MALHYFQTVLPVLPSTTLQAAAADIVVNDHVLSITGLAPMDYRIIQSGSNLAPVAEVLEVWTLTPTAANSTTFAFVISQYVQSLGRIVTRTISHETFTSGATATTIANAWRTEINLYDDIKITASGGATLILTAETGSPIFEVVVIQTGATIGAVNGTAGVHSRGTYADLVIAGVPTALLTGGATYNTITFEYEVQAPALLCGNVESEINRQILYVPITSANFAAFNTRIDEVLNAFAAGTTVSDPELIAMQ